VTAEPEAQDPIENDEDTLDEENEGVDDQQVEEEVREVSEKALADFFSDVKPHMDSLRAVIQTLNARAFAEIDQRLFFDSRETQYHSCVHELVHVVEQRQQRQPVIEGGPLTTHVSQELDTVIHEAMAQRKRIGSQQRENRARTRRIALAVFLGLAVSGALAPYVLFRVDDNGDPEPHGDFTSADAEKARAILQAWRKVPDDAMWEHLAQYVDRSRPSLQTQMMMMGYIKNWAPGSAFEWTSTDKLHVIQSLQEALRTRRELSTLYRTVMDPIYQSQPLPRGIAADCCELALAHLLPGA
jgi:hypothetical protein